MRTQLLGLATFLVLGCTTSTEERSNAAESAHGEAAPVVELCSYTPEAVAALAALADTSASLNRAGAKRVAPGEMYRLTLTKNAAGKWQLVGERIVEGQVEASPDRGDRIAVDDESGRSVFSVAKLPPPPDADVVAVVLVDESILEREKGSVFLAFRSAEAAYLPLARTEAAERVRATMPGDAAPESERILASQWIESILHDEFMLRCEPQVSRARPHH
jgi:hypothetical protein